MQRKHVSPIIIWVILGSALLVTAGCGDECETCGAEKHEDNRQRTDGETDSETASEGEADNGLTVSATVVVPNDFTGTPLQISAFFYENLEAAMTGAMPDVMGTAT